MIQLSDTQVKKIKQVTGYRGRNVKLENFKPGMGLASYWDEGSKNNFWIMVMRFRFHLMVDRFKKMKSNLKILKLIKL